MDNKVQTNTSNTIKIFENIFLTGATLAWILIAFTTFIDVLLRYVFSTSIPGGYEVIKTLMVVGIFFSLPQAALKHSHVCVELVIQNLSESWQLASKLTGAFVGVFFFGFITWRVYYLTIHAFETGEVTTYLRLPLWWVMVLMVIIFLL